MVIEFLYPELANLYGESGHRRFLKMLFPDAEFIETSLSDRPGFSQRKIDFLFLGALSERAQEKVILALLPYKAALLNCFDAGCHALFTGNALEVLGRQIETDQEKIIPALDLFPYTARRQMDKRLNCFYIGTLFGALAEEVQAQDFNSEIVGFKSQFSQCFPLAGEGLAYFCQTTKGFGMNEAEIGEGFIYKNVVATYLLGPLLILNPDFTKSWLGKISELTPKLPFEETLRAAFEARLEDFRKDDTVL